jgi:hypothetical protein
MCNGTHGAEKIKTRNLSARRMFEINCDQKALLFTDAGSEAVNHLGILWITKRSSIMAKATKKSATAKKAAPQKSPKAKTAAAKKPAAKKPAAKKAAPKKSPKAKKGAAKKPAARKPASKKA